MPQTVKMYPQKGPGSDMSHKFRAILEKRKKAIKEPLTPEKLRKRPGMENMSDENAIKVIEATRVKGSNLN